MRTRASLHMLLKPLVTSLSPLTTRPWCSASYGGAPWSPRPPWRASPRTSTPAWAPYSSWSSHTHAAGHLTLPGREVSVFLVPWVFVRVVQSLLLEKMHRKAPPDPPTLLPSSHFCLLRPSGARGWHGTGWHSWSSSKSPGASLLCTARTFDPSLPPASTLQTL